MTPLLLAVCFLLLNISFVLVEYALVRLSPSRVELLVRQGHRRGVLLQNMLRRLDSYLSAVQLGITIASLGLGWVGEPAVAERLRPLLEGLLPASLLGTASHAVSIGLAFVLLTFVQIVVGELVPRTIVIQHVEPIALWVAYPFEVFYRIFRLPIVLMAKTSTALVRLMGFRPAGEHEQVFSEEEIRVLLGASQEKGLVPLDRLLIIENLFDFSSLKARDAMVPSVRAETLDLAKPWEENRRTVLKNRFSRYPVRESDGPIKGYVHLKDFALADPKAGPVDLRKIVREFTWVTEAEPLPALMKTMQAKGVVIAGVRDAAGRFAGLITLEDIIEELLGEIHDEFDIPQAFSLHRQLTNAHVDMDVKGETPQQAIRHLLERLKAVRPDLNVDAVFKTVWEREEALSTGIGKGVAVPHARLEGLDRPCVLVGRSAKPIAFPHPDKVPVRLVFLLLTPTSEPREQVRLLARVAVLCSHDSLRRRLLRAKSADHFLDLLRTSEALLAG
jgi:CBS domain containing-hemolysin-like protein